MILQGQMDQLYQSIRHKNKFIINLENFVSFYFSNVKLPLHISDVFAKWNVFESETQIKESVLLIVFA